MMLSILITLIIASFAGLVLWFSQIKTFNNEFGLTEVVDPEVVDKILPQTQCGECGFDGCRPYAEAIIQGRAAINLCPPGGETTIDKLADLLGYPQPQTKLTVAEQRPFRLAVIDEDQCIGCTKCIQACPVDAIIGAAKQMHTIINERCTGCELCLPPCPVDCIEMVLPVQTYESLT